MLVAELQQIAGAAADDLAWIWDLSPESEMLAALRDVLPAALDTYASAASVAASDSYDAARVAAEVAGSFEAIVAPVRDLGASMLIEWTTEKAKSSESLRSYVEGGVQRRLMNTANETVTLSAVEDPQARGWRRTTRVGACDFCRMVAGRGAIYRKSTARFSCHNDCYCSAVPSWGGSGVRVDAYKASVANLRLTDVQRARMNARARAWIANNLT